MLKNLDLGSVALKKTTTRVRKRDGTIHFEENGERVEGGEQDASADEASTPQYVIDQEAGISRLQPKRFDVASNRWVPLVTGVAAQGSPPGDPAAGAGRDGRTLFGGIRSLSHLLLRVSQAQHVTGLPVENAGA